MPLPFAPPPKDSNLYQQLESTTLKTLSADQLDTIRAKTFSQGTEGNEDEYRRLLLLGLAANELSLSGPLAGTAHIVQISDIDADQILYQPSEGTWQLMGGDILETNGGATFTMALDLKDADGKMAFLGTCSTTGQESIAKDLTYSMSSPIYVTNEVYLWGDRQAGEGRCTLAFIRVR